MNDGRVSGIVVLTPPAITAADVKARRAATGRSMMECKAALEHERLMVLIQMFDLHGERRQLTEILFALANGHGRRLP